MKKVYKKVYVVLGRYSNNNTRNSSYSILSAYSIKSTLKKAQYELKLIKKEIIADYADYNGLDINNLKITTKHFYKLVQENLNLSLIVEGDIRK